MPTTMGCKDIAIRKSEFVAKTQFLYGFKYKFLNDVLDVLAKIKTRCATAGFQELKIKY